MISWLLALLASSHVPYELLALVFFVCLVVVFFFVCHVFKNHFFYLCCSYFFFAEKGSRTWGRNIQNFLIFLVKV